MDQFKEHVLEKNKLTAELEDTEEINLEITESILSLKPGDLMFCDNAGRYNKSKFNMENFKTVTSSDQKKIIGYKLIKPQYKECVKSIVKNVWFETHFDENIKDLGYNFCDSDEELSICQVIKESGVLDIWFEPVYESSTEQKIMNYLFNSFGIDIAEEKASHIVKIVNEK